MHSLPQMTTIRRLAQHNRRPAVCLPACQRAHLAYKLMYAPFAPPESCISQLPASSLPSASQCKKPLRPFHRSLPRAQSIRIHTCTQTLSPCRHLLHSWTTGIVQCCLLPQIPRRRSAPQPPHHAPTSMPKPLDRSRKSLQATLPSLPPSEAELRWRVWLTRVTSR
jgi:hypothetical protein